MFPNRSIPLIFGGLLVAAMAFAGCGRESYAAQGSRAMPALARAPFERTKLPIVDGATAVYRHVEYSIVLHLKGTPEPTLPQTWSDTVTAHAGATLGGIKNLMRYHLHSPNKPTPSRFGDYDQDAYFSAQFDATIGGRLEEVAANSANLNAQVVNGAMAYDAYRWTTPLLEVPYPFSAGAAWGQNESYTDVWSIGPVPTHENPTPPPQITGVITRNGDGSFSASSQGGAAYPASYQSQLQSDGAFFERDRQARGCAVVVKIGTPENARSGYVIPFSYGGIHCRSIPKPQATTIPDWYPGGGSAPSPLSRVRARDEGVVTIAASCHVPAYIARTGELVVVEGQSLDPRGTVTKESASLYYSPDIGLVCALRKAEVRFYVKGKRADGARIVDAVSLVKISSKHSFTPDRAAEYVLSSGSVINGYIGDRRRDDLSRP